MEEKFLLKENAFVGFLFRYAPVIFYGSIALTFLMNFVKIDIVDVVTKKKLDMWKTFETDLRKICLKTKESL